MLPKRLLKVRHIVGGWHGRSVTCKLLIHVSWSDTNTAVIIALRVVAVAQN